MGYNWNFIAGTTVPTLSSGALSQTAIAASAENVRPSNAVYIAYWGNDTLGNGSRDKPFRTITQGNTVVGNTTTIFVFGEGLWNEGGFTYTGIRSYVANSQGNVIFEGTGISSFSNSNNSTGELFFGIKISNYNIISPISYSIGFVKCTIKNVNQIKGANNLGSYVYMQDTECISTILNTVGGAQSDYSRVFKNNSFFNCQIIFTTNATSFLATKFANYNNVFKSCQIRITGANVVSPEFWVIDPNNTFNFAASGGTFSSYASLAALRTAFITAWPTQTTNFVNCLYTDPLFVDSANDELSLQLASPARNFSFDGSYTGAKSTAFAWNLNTDVIASTNITNTSGVLSLTTDALSEFTLKALDLGSEYELNTFPIQGNIAVRNGEVLAYTRDLSSSSVSAGTGVLTLRKNYVVEMASITWNTNILTIGSKFTPTGSESLDFTTTSAGVVREIIDSPARRSGLLRFKSSLSGSAISSGTGVLTIGSDYQVIGTATHNSIAYTNAQTFRAANTAFTGTGTVKEVFNSSDNYFPYQLNGTKMTVNRVGNVGSGVISKGNGDITFDITPANMFAVFGRYIQAKIVVQNDNLI